MDDIVHRPFGVLPQSAALFSEAHANIKYQNTIQGRQDEEMGSASTNTPTKEEGAEPKIRSILAGGCKPHRLPTEIARWLNGLYPVVCLIIPENDHIRARAMERWSTSTV